MGLPLIWLIGAALMAVPGGTSGLFASMLPVAIKETATLMISVGISTAILGLVAA